MNSPNKPIKTSNQKMMPDEALKILYEGVSCKGKTNQEPLFKVGEKVQSINNHSKNYTRLPRYAKGKVGKIESIRGVFVFPDTIAHRKGLFPQYLYSVVFTKKELWGKESPNNEFVYLDLYEMHLEKI